MNRLPEYLIQDRMRHFDGPLTELINNNGPVRQVYDLYIRGHIVTKEEALSQMLVALYRSKSVADEMREILNLTSPPFIQKP